MSGQNHTNRFTRWAVIASGEGGGRIASRFFSRRENPGVEERIVVMNTNRTDIGNTIQRLEGKLGNASFEDHVVTFGDDEGAGNVFADGEDLARGDFDKIIGSINNIVETGDAFMHVATLGGGTGNGSIPYVIRKLNEGVDSPEYEDWMNDVIHAAMGVWPYEDEPPQQQFNAVCGLSRLLRRPDGTQNADMVLLGANSHIAQLEEQDEANGRPNDAVNERLIEAFDLMISAGRETRGVIDVQDYISVPSQIGAYHFTPAVATEMNANVYDLEYMFDMAAENAFVPLDVGTTKAAYAIVRVPRTMDEDEYTESEVNSVFESWKRKKGIDAPGMSTVSIKDGSRNQVDVLILLGGFDLDPLLDQSWSDYETHKGRLDRGRRLGNTSISAEQMQRIEDNLKEYMRFLEE
ncbi:FtsZ/tubulin family protein [Halorubrum gandharaense]